MMVKEKCSKTTVLIALLAGGRSSRMGGKNKALLPWGKGETLVRLLLDRLGKEGTDFVISANHDLESFEKLGVPVIVDDFGAYAGPLAGILSVMNWAEDNRPGAGYIALCSCDTPFVPQGLANQLAEAADLGAAGSPLLVLPQTGGRVHPLHGLWSLSLRSELKQYLEADGRRVQEFGRKFSPHLVSFSPVILKNGSEIDPFTNINTPEDYQRYRYME